jgi:hypothetical protein
MVAGSDARGVSMTSFKAAVEKCGVLADNKVYGAILVLS